MNTQTPNSRTFAENDLVEYRPYEDCSRKDVSGPGKVAGVLSDGFYRVFFGDPRRINWWSECKYHWSKLYPLIDPVKEAAAETAFFRSHPELNP